MELRHLRYFVATCDAGTVSAAAEALHLTQPGLSRQLRQLETELGARLFDRAGGRLSPSPVGRALLPDARDLLARAESFAVAATFYAHGRLDRLTVAAPTVTLTDVIAPFIATLAPEDPTIDVRTADGVAAAEALARGAELAITTTRSRPPLADRVIASVPVWAYVPAFHPWAAREEVRLAELTEQPLVLLPPAFTARQSFDTALHESGLVGAEILEAANGTVAQALVAAGRGIAVVSDDPRFGLVPLRIRYGRAGNPLQVRLVAVWDGRHPAARTLARLAERIEGFVGERYPAEVSGLRSPAGAASSGTG